MLIVKTNLYEKVGNVVQQIVAVLECEGEQTKDRIVSQTGLSAEEVLLGLGWLVKEKRVCCGEPKAAMTTFKLCEQ